MNKKSLIIWHLCAWVAALGYSLYRGHLIGVLPILAALGALVTIIGAYLGEMRLSSASTGVVVLMLVFTAEDPGPLAPMAVVAIFSLALGLIYRATPGERSESVDIRRHNA